MALGAFSVSLAVKDLQAARAFYEKLGFARTGGDGKGYLIMVNGGATVGLFQGMFEGNILTFNPGMRQDGSPLDHFTDIREIRAALVAGGIDDDGYRPERPAPLTSPSAIRTATPS